MAVFMKKNNQLVSLGHTTKETALKIYAESDVNFYDYDGTVLYAYSKTDFLALSAMPANPSHTGLVAQGWNWTLNDAQTYVTSYGMLQIGQIYTTASGKNEFDIELTVATGLSVTLNMDGNKDWGDGTTDTNTSHTYSTYGEYTIKCDGTTMTTSSSSGLFGQVYDSGYNYYCKRARFSSITAISRYSLCLCRSLENLIISNTTTTIEDYAFMGELILKTILIPNTITTLGNFAFSGCLSSKILSLPNSITTYGTNIFQNHKCELLSIPLNFTNITSSMFANYQQLKRMSIPNTITMIQSSAFSGYYSLKEYDFSNFNSIPTLLSANVFTNMTKLCKIIVPDSLYNSWAAATNWSTYANYIYPYSAILPDTASFISMYPDFTWKGRIITSYTGSDTNVIIPEGCTSIADNVFDASSETSIQIPSTVESIGNRNFYDCPNLTTIKVLATTPPELPQATKEFVPSIFNKSDNLTAIYVPSSSVSAYQTAPT